MAKHKGLSIQNAYFAIEVPEFVVVPAGLVHWRMEGKLESGALDFWCVLYYLNYRRAPISYTVLEKYLQWGRGKIAKFIQQFKELGCLEVSTHRGQAFYKLVWRGSSITEPPSSITEPPSSITELPSSITELPSSITELPSSITELPSSITELPQFQNRTAVSSNGGGEIKIFKKEEDLLRDAPEPRETAQPVIPTAAPAQPESSFIHTEKKEARSAPTSSVDVRTGDWREAGEHLRAFIAKMKQKDSHAPPESSFIHTEKKSDFAKQLEDARRELINAGISPATADHLLQRHHPARILYSLRSPASPLAIIEVREHLRAAQGLNPLRKGGPSGLNGFGDGECSAAAESTTLESITQEVK